MFSGFCSYMENMARNVISVCIFCLLCATHTPCESHAAIMNKTSQNYILRNSYKDPNKSPPLLPDENSFDDSQEKYNNNRIDHIFVKRDTNSTNKSNHIHSNLHSDYYLKTLFEMYGDGKTMNLEGFEKLMQHLDLTQQITNDIDKNYPKTSLNNINNNTEAVSHEHKTHNHSCLHRDEILTVFKSSSSSLKSDILIDNDNFKSACPAILYSMVMGSCVHEEATHLKKTTVEYNPQLSVWLYSNLAVALISACGILGLAVIPIMQKRFYQPLLQFLVALAVGTLAGDALLHLLPHAMSHTSNHIHEHEQSHSHVVHDHDSEHINMWKGFVAMLGLVFFFLMERIITVAAKWRKGRQLKDKLPKKLKVMNNERSTQLTNASEKQCKHKYSSFPYCYDEIKMLDAPNDDHMFRLAGGTDSVESHNNTQTTTLDDLGSSSDIQSFKTTHFNNHKIETNQNMTECPNDITSVACTEINKMLVQDNKDETDSVEYTVILREHENRHHGHSHTHGHVHSAPSTLSSVAWMVIMGDGLHNFTDGMAIGAAFASGIAGGFSTTVAVFCHELPHELGDFAMLLKAGMSMKQALFYNLLSSILCVLGNCFGVWLGKTDYASAWVFSAAAGMFLYIALVDMIPELSSGHENEGTLVQCFLHLGGLLIGFGIMTLIALYEHDLKNIFHET